MPGDHNGGSGRFGPLVIGLSVGQVIQYPLRISHDWTDRGLKYMQAFANIPMNGHKKSPGITGAF
jgi:hypothetical protein